MTAPPLELRPYQQRLVDDIRAAMGRCRRVRLQAPPGAGKTVIFGRIASGVVARGRRALILVHRRELIRQTIEKLALFGVEPGVIAAGWPADPERQIQVASVQTLARRLDQTPAADLVIIDECHHAVAGTWAAVIDRCPAAYQLGVTAAQERLDGKGLADQFDELVCAPSAAELTEAGYLAAAKVLTVPAPDLTGVKTVAGDFAAGALADVMSVGGLVGDAVAHYRDHADGVPAIAFCVTVGHAIRLAGMRLSGALELCPTEADLRLLGQLRGYKPGFAWAVMQERRGRRAATLPIRGQGAWDAARAAGDGQ